jgi:hypothetical protein
LSKTTDSATGASRGIDAAIAEHPRPTASTLRTRLGAELTVAKIELATTHQRDSQKVLVEETSDEEKGMIDDQSPVR